MVDLILENSYLVCDVVDLKIAGEGIRNWLLWIGRI
jgi:hypothetical protein